MPKDSFQVGLINAQMGNVASVRNALYRIGANVLDIRTPEDIRHCDRLILPGVGSFPDAKRKLDRADLCEPIRSHANIGKPILGICVGMHLLATEGHEFEITPGLGLMPGVVGQIDAPNLAVPHMGWSKVACDSECPLFNQIENPTFYFLHSFAFLPDDNSDIAATCHQGERIIAATARGNVYGVQFHPEKSQDDGLRLLHNFVELAA